MMPTRGYLLCCIERTGSNLLAKALEGTNLAGRPLEYFNPVEQEKQWMRNILGDCNVVDGLPQILSAGTTPNGVFGAKIHWGHFRFLGLSLTGEWADSRRLVLLDVLRSHLPELLPQATANALLQSQFPNVGPLAIAYAALRGRLKDVRVIWLKRRNMVARAVSDFRARKTGVWYKALSNKSDTCDKQICNFDLGEIHCLYCFGSFQENMWRQLFQEEEIHPHVMNYEEIVADYDSTVRGTLEFLRLNSNKATIPPIVSAQQADDLSMEWEDLYRKVSAEHGLLL
jgi:LPS sulfotransferase NodH